MPDFRVNPTEVESMYILGISAFYHDSAASVVKNGEIVNTVNGKIYWVNIEASENLLEAEPELQRIFEEYYTVQYENYVVPQNFSPNQKPISVKASI